MARQSDRGVIPVTNEIKSINASILETLPAELQRIARELEGEGLINIIEDRQPTVPTRSGVPTFAKESIRAMSPMSQEIAALLEREGYVRIANEPARI